MNRLYLIPLLVLLNGCMNQSQQKIAGGSISESPNNDMIFFSGGSFLSENIYDTMEVSLSPFLLDRHEVTIGQFAEFIKATGYITDAEKEGCTSLIIEKNSMKDVGGVNWRHDEYGKIRRNSDYDFPVVHVSYNDAAAYAKWAGKRLPNLFEWEYAAKDRWLSLKRNEGLQIKEWFDENSGLRIHKVCTGNYTDNQICDILGNVSEIVETPEQIRPALNRSAIKIENKQLSKGGSFFFDFQLMNPDLVYEGSAIGKSCCTGFRCAKDTLISSLPDQN